VTTLAALCESHGGAEIDFLKIDVEGAEFAVLSGGDWQKFRPKVVVLEAFAPVTLAPAWEACERLLTANDYRYAFFDSLNRYYVANQCGDIADRLAAEPPSYDNVKKFCDYKPALDDVSHPDHRLATLLAKTDLVRLPLLEPNAVTALLAADITAADLDRTATAADLGVIHERLFGGNPAIDWIAALNLSRDATIRDAYCRIISSERFRAACGRISASYAW
jgi:methyltransferase FkbM-like protein